MFGNLSIERGWEQFTNIFVLDITLVCALDTAICGDVGNQEAHVSCSCVHSMQFPSKIVFFFWWYGLMPFLMGVKVAKH